jgi:hypothetical protein
MDLNPPHLLHPSRQFRHGGQPFWNALRTPVQTLLHPRCLMT